MKRLNASVIITTLITLVIIFILAVILIDIVYFSMNNSEREAQVNQGRWFIEGRVQEYFDSLLTGGKPFTTGKSIFHENAGGNDQSYQLNIQKKKSNTYSLDISVNWKNRYSVGQYIEFDRLNLFDYAIFIYKKNFNPEKSVIIAGNIGNIGIESASAGEEKRFYCYYSQSLIPRIDYYSSQPQLHPFFFTNNPFEPATNSDMITQLSVFEKIAINYQKLDKKPELPDFTTVWNACLTSRDNNWIISKEFPASEYNIVNPLSAEKELIAVGDGYSTEFNVKTDSIHTVYIKKLDSYLKRQYINPAKYSYYYGEEDKSRFFSYNRGKLELKASARAIQLSLPDDSYKNLGNFTLRGSDYSFISDDESIGKIYFARASLTGMLAEGIDYKFDYTNKSVILISDKFYLMRTIYLGSGDGNTTFFPFIKISGNYLYYSDDKRIYSYDKNENGLILNPPPKKGAKIIAFSPPPFFLKKAPPSRGCGIFIDKTDRCAVLDLSSIRSFPKNGVILSYVPLLIKGESSFPLIILSKDEIYLESVNPGNTGKPVLFASGKGVWIYRKIKSNIKRFNKCIIYTPLNGLYSVNEGNAAEKTPVTIYGTVIFTSENSNGTDGTLPFGNNYIYYPGITNEMKEMPFSIFPMPLNIDLVKRN